MNDDELVIALVKNRQDLAQVTEDFEVVRRVVSRTNDSLYKFQDKFPTSEGFDKKYKGMEIVKAKILRLELNIRTRISNIEKEFDLLIEEFSGKE